MRAVAEGGDRAAIGDLDGAGITALAPGATASAEAAEAGAAGPTGAAYPTYVACGDDRREHRGRVAGGDRQAALTA